MKKKTHSGAKKRFERRKSGTIYGANTNQKHLLMNKARRSRRPRPGSHTLSEVEQKRLERLLAS